MIDLDIENMTLDQLKDEVKKLREGIRQHRDATGHDLCWYVPELWDLLPEGYHPDPEIPPIPEFIHHCALYRMSLEKKPSNK